MGKNAEYRRQVVAYCGICDCAVVVERKKHEGWKCLSRVCLGDEEIDVKPVAVNISFRAKEYTGGVFGAGIFACPNNQLEI